MSQDLHTITAPRSVTLRALFRAPERVALPPFLGGTIHGALGHALDAICGKSEAILGPRPAPDEAPAFVRANPPPVCVIAPPPPGQPRTLSAGEELEIGILLVAPDVARVGIMIGALERMGKVGLGRGRGRLDMIGVDDAQGTRVWADGRVLCTPADDVAPRADGPGPWLLRTTTPLHLVRRGVLEERPTAANVVVAAARRLLGLAWTHGSPADVHLADFERTARERLDPSSPGDWSTLRAERWSNRQRRFHPVEGVVGSLRLPDTIAPYMPLLCNALRFGLGKGTALGLGRLELVLGAT